MHLPIEAFSNLFFAHSLILSERCASDSSIEVVREHQAAPQRLFTRSQCHAFSPVLVQTRLREAFPATIIKPSGIHCPKTGAKHTAVPSLQPVTRILIPSSCPVLMACGGTLSGSSGSYVRLYTKCPHFTRLRSEPSKRVRAYDDLDMGDAGDRYLHAGDLTSSSVSSLQGEILPHGPLPILASPGLRFWTYG